MLALKGNQGTFNDDVRLFLETELKKSSSTVIDDHYEEANKGHGRIETRTCYVSSQIDWLTQKEQWAGLKTVAMIEETQEKMAYQALSVVFLLVVYLLHDFIS